MKKLTKTDVYKRQGVHNDSTHYSFVSWNSYDTRVLHSEGLEVYTRLHLYNYAMLDHSLYVCLRVCVCVCARVRICSPLSFISVLLYEKTERKSGWNLRTSHVEVRDNK